MESTIVFKQQQCISRVQRWVNEMPFSPQNTSLLNANVKNFKHFPQQKFNFHCWFITYNNILFQSSKLLLCNISFKFPRYVNKICKKNIQRHNFNVSWHLKISTNRSISDVHLICYRFHQRKFAHQN